jgi:hypothetical protein
MFEIRDDVPLPSTSRGSLGNVVEAIKSMTVGQSFVMPIPIDKEPAEFRTNLTNGVRSILRREGAEIGFVARVIEGGTIIGIWRTEYTAPKARKPKDAASVTNLPKKTKAA